MSGVIISPCCSRCIQIDNMSNAMPNPLFVLGLGGLCGLVKEGVTKPATASRLIEESDPISRV